jgi:hypothetical protein
MLAILSDKRNGIPFSKQIDEAKLTTYINRGEQMLKTIVEMREEERNHE